MIIPPMDGDHFGMGPGAQRSSAAELTIFRFFSYNFCFAPHDPILVPESQSAHIPDSTEVEESNRVEKSRLAQLLRLLGPKNQKSRFRQ